MSLALFSRDLELYRLCCEILAEITGGEWKISRIDPQAGASTNSGEVPAIYLWDIESDTCSSDVLIRHGSTHLFLVGRKDLPGMRAHMEQAGGNILLKPATRATLTAFLSLAILTHEHRIPAVAALREDRDEMLQCLMQTNLRLQEYDQDRTAFLARAIHDFRAPLTALSGYCGLLLSGSLGALTDDQREVLKRMLNSAHRLTRLSSSMFQLSVGRHMKRRPVLRPAGMQGCLDQALHEIAPFSEDKSVVISSNLNLCPGTLLLETGQIEQVLINILHNACKFTPKSGRIEITGYPYFWERRHMQSCAAVERRETDNRNANSYRIDICNSGPMIPLEHLDSIFEEYTSYGGGTDRSGGGLGLAICRMIVAEHEGHIWAQNTGSGPMLSFVLPLCASVPATARETSEGDQTVLAEAR